MTPAPFVIFGYNHFTCDIAEIIQARGDRVARLVLNRAERQIPGKPTLADWLGRQKELGRDQGVPPIECAQDADFRPGAGERFAMGFSGAGREPWVEGLRTRHGLTFETLVHPSAVVSRSAVLGEGCVVCAGAIVAAEVRVGAHVTLNRGCTIGHHAALADYAVVQPGANLASFVRVGRGAVVGVGASVIEDRVIGEYSRVAAGAAVIADVPPRTLVAGVPAQVKRQLEHPPAPP